MPAAIPRPDIINGGRVSDVQALVRFEVFQTGGFHRLVKDSRVRFLAADLVRGQDEVEVVVQFDVLQGDVESGVEVRDYANGDALLR